MKYEKPALTVEDQVQRLCSRGLVGDAERMAAKLREVSYYRLAGYTFPFLDGGDRFRPGTTFATIWDHYVFDRKLRLLALDAIERIEVSVRARLSYHTALEHGPFALWQAPNALALPGRERNDLLLRLRTEIKRSEKEQFLQHFFKKYGDQHTDPPIWMVTEVLSFGNVVRLVDKTAEPVRKEVAGSYGVPNDVLVSWLRTLNVVRNTCAHHARLWNRRLPYRLRIPRARKFPEWHDPVVIGDDRLFGVLTIIRFLLAQISPGSRWSERLHRLLAEHPNISRSAMGFPTGWEASPLWKDEGERRR